MSRVAVAPDVRLAPQPRGGRPRSRRPSAVAVWRAALVNRLRAARSYPLATVVAPTGYGKTTLLRQWAARDERPFIWLGPDRGDAAEASRVAREPAVVVVDDAHLLDGRALAQVAQLSRLARDGAMVVLSGRSEPRLPGLSVPRLRARGELLELGAADLALTRREARAMARALGASLDEEDLSRLMDETEGWPAAVRLALSQRGYRSLQSACLAALTPRQRAFLRRTSVLERLSRPLCDAVLDSQPATHEPGPIDDLNAFLVPLDRRREWFRFHPLLRERLRRELEASEPGLAEVLHERAAAWYQANGDSVSAIQHAHAAGNSARFMAIFATEGLAAHHRGDGAVPSWLGSVDAMDNLDRYPEAATLAARLHSHRGNALEAARCLAAATRSDEPSPATRARTALVRAATAARSPRAMAASAEAALADLLASDPWRAYGLLVQGVACVLLGDEERADALLDLSARAAGRHEATETQALAFTERALLADARDDHVLAEALLARAHALVDGVEQPPSAALMLAASARGLLRRGRWGEARRSLGEANELLPGLTEALPWLAVQTRAELAAAYLMLRDSSTAQRLLDEAGALARRRRLGSLDRRLSLLAAEIAEMPARDPGRTVRLTGAELKLLPLLATHLSFREIGEHLYLSRHTVKTQAISAYRKLGASSRSEAVQRAEQLGLIEADAVGSTVLVPGG